MVSSQSETRRSKTFVIDGPTDRRDGGPDYDHLAEEFGELVRVVDRGEYLLYDQETITRRIIARMKGYDPQIDFVVWTGGDPLSTLVIGSALAAKGVREITWLRFDRNTTPSGQRLSWDGKYVPIKIKLPTMKKGRAYAG